MVLNHAFRTYTMSQNSQTSLVRGADGRGEASTPARPADGKDSRPPPVTALDKQGAAADKRAEFRRRVGIKATGVMPPDVEAALQGRSQRRRRRDAQSKETNAADFPQGALPDEYEFQHRLEAAYHRQTTYYFLVAGATYGMLCLQVAIGATVTALGSNADRSARVAVTVLGAINTVIAGLLTFLKSRNQPNRALQFRNGLRGVYEDLWRADSEMLSAQTDAEVDKKVGELWKKYKEVRTEAENNYPDLWVSLKNFTRPVNGNGDGDGNTNPPTDETHTGAPAANPPPRETQARP